MAKLWDFLYGMISLLEMALRQCLVPKAENLLLGLTNFNSQ
jgi:hypothetical protein